MRSSRRSWRHPGGYRYLAPWTNAVLLRFLVRKFTETLPHSEYRAETQINDAARSVVANIEEGYKRSTTEEYIKFLGYSQGSLEEVKGDIKRFFQDGFLDSKPGSELADINIDLREFKGKLGEVKGKKKARKLEVLYPPLATLKGNDLTYEMFMELINKTDYLFRQLVQSLERKADKEVPMSARQKWLKRKMEQRRRESRAFDKKMLEEQGFVFTGEGVMSKEEAEKKGLEEIDIP